MPVQHQIAESEDAQPFVGIEADPVIGRAIGAPALGSCGIRIRALLNHRHVRPQREQAVELAAQRHVAVPGYDAQLDGDLRPWTGFDLSGA